MPCHLSAGSLTSVPAFPTPPMFEFAAGLCTVRSQEMYRAQAHSHESVPRAQSETAVSRSCSEVSGCWRPDCVLQRHVWKSQQPQHLRLHQPCYYHSHDTAATQAGRQRQVCKSCWLSSCPKKVSQHQTTRLLPHSPAAGGSVGQPRRFIGSFQGRPGFHSGIWHCCYRYVCCCVYGGCLRAQTAALLPKAACLPVGTITRVGLSPIVCSVSSHSSLSHAILPG